MMKNLDKHLEISRVIWDYVRVAGKVNELYGLCKKDPDLADVVENLPTDYKVVVDYQIYDDAAVVMTRVQSSAFKRTQAISIITIPYDVSKKELKEVEKLFKTMTGLEGTLDELIEFFDDEEEEENS